MNDEELAQVHRDRAVELRAKADREDEIAAMYDGGGGSPVKRRGKAASPKSSGAKGAPGKKGATRARVLEFLRAHPKAMARQVADALDLTPAAAAYHLTAINKGK